jgi:sec-independent protein translocase protein TatC
MPNKHDYSEDMFADTRMTFGEHIEELRKHLWSAIKGLLFFLFIGFFLDAIGYFLEWPWLGIGRPMMTVITRPVTEQLTLFFDRQEARLLSDRDKGDPDAVETTKPQSVSVEFSHDALAAMGVANPPIKSVRVNVLMDPVDVYRTSKRIHEQVHKPGLTTLSVQESMVVYIKVSLLCGLVLASPWVFWQLWSFVAAGMYPHEKRYVHRYLPLSVGLFLGGVFLCQFAIIPQSISALLWFNDWLGLTPDLRLNEWLGFAILLPIVFGISFQTPLIMLFLERIGIMTVERYWGAWRLAVIILAVFAALITPTPDAVTMMAMLIPLCGLYFLGIYLCKWSGSGRPDDERIDELDVDELVEA